MKTFFLSFIVGIQFAAAMDKKFICTDGYTANLRSEPTTASSVVTKLSKYTPLIPLEKEGSWTKVKTGSFVGWIHEALLDQTIQCVTSTKSYKTHESYTSSTPHRYRKNVLTGEGFQILETEVGMTQVKDKTGNVFWLENHILWPKDKLESLSLSL